LIVVGLGVRSHLDPFALGAKTLGRMNRIDRPRWSRHRLVLIALLGLLAASAGLTLSTPSMARAPSALRDRQDAERYDSIAGITFSCPKGFDRRPTEESYQVAYLRCREGDLALFLAVPPANARDEYVKRLGTFLVSYLFPEEWAIFAWKDLGQCAKVSRFETNGGWLQGFNGSQRVGLLYRSLSINGKQITVGYLFGLDREAAAESAFQQGLPGQSIPGRDALSHLIASITHEAL
jgi:hypothetical protein